MVLGEPAVEGFALVLFEFLDEGVLHFCQEGGIKLVPLRRFQVGLLQLSHLAENVNVASHMQVPTLDTREVTDREYLLGANW